MKYLIFAFCIGMAGCSSPSAPVSDTSDSATPDLTKGQSLFAAQCATCHGPSAAGMQALNAPALAGQEAWYMQRQLRHFRSGVRGADTAHVPGTQMAAIAKTLTSEADIAAVSAYIASLPITKNSATVKGDAAMGKAQFNTVCTACHGNNADGNKALNSPRLSGLNDWYIAAQMEQFINGSRGTHALDTFGQQMRPMAMTVTDSQTALDIATYITSLQSAP